MIPPVVVHVDALLFDSDGVLVDSHGRGELAWTRLAEEFGLDVATVLAEMPGVPAAQTLARHLDGDRLRAAVDRLEDLEVETAHGTPPIAGARALLRSLPDDAYAFVTSASHRLAVARWSAAGIDPPRHVVTADDVDRGKPFPEPFLVGARRLGVDPARCVVFEDSEAGGTAARAAGAAVVAVGAAPWTGAAVARIADLTAVRVVPGRASRWTVEIDRTSSPATGA